MVRLSAIVLALLVTAAPLAAQPGGFKKRVAFVVGVNEYQKPGFERLDFAERDAEELAAAFKDVLKFDRVVLLKGADATAKRVRDELAKAVGDLDKNCLCVVALSGHGLQFEAKDGTEEAFFCPVDAVCPRRSEPAGPKNAGANLCSMRELTGVLQQNAGTNLLLVDACRSEPPLDGKGAKGVEGVDDYPVENRMAILFSCSARQRAWEHKEAGGGHSVFTWCVLEGLRGGAKDADGELTWLGLVKYVDKAMKKEETKKLLFKPQEPALSTRVSRDVVLARLGDGTKVELKDDPDVIRFKVGDEKFEMKFARVPGGTFTMGSTKEALALVKQKFGFAPDNEDAHAVELSAFALGKYPVTRGQFALFVKDAGYTTEAEAGDGGHGWNEDAREFEGPDKKYSWRNPGFAQTDGHPVVNVTWNDAQKFCAWLGKKSGKRVGLPSEAQWEYACRAGSTTLYFFGDDEEEMAAYGNIADGTAKAKFPGWKDAISAKDGYAFTSPVGSYKPNKFGLYDMHGNVWQWCADYYRKYDDVPKGKDPVQTIKQSDSRRVLRGGS
jgi:sulfatase modifying factor 1